LFLHGLAILASVSIGFPWHRIHYLLVTSSIGITPELPCRMRYGSWRPAMNVRVAWRYSPANSRCQRFMEVTSFIRSQLYTCGKKPAILIE
jgi:hypothetical protein